MVAVPFLLDLFQIPADMFQLFVVADNIVGNRFGATLAAMHTIALVLLSVRSTSFRLYSAMSSNSPGLSPMPGGS